MHSFLALALAYLLTPTVQAPAPPKGASLRVVAATASSALPKFQSYTFDAANLIDGNVETSWQPAKKDAMGVGQWVELDLGATYEVSSVEIEQGLQKVDPKLGDLFCRNNRFATATLLFDDGSHALVGAPANQKKLEVATFFRGEMRLDQVKVVTRYVRLVVTSVHEPVDWKDIAIAEIRVFGRAVDAPKVDPGTVACDRPGAWPFKVAVIETCAAKAETRLQHDCAVLLNTYAACRAYDRGAYTMVGGIAAGDIAKGEVMQTLTIDGVHHRLEFKRAADGRWSIKRHTRLTEAGKPADPGDETLVEEDMRAENGCWEKLGKERPNGATPSEETPE